MAEGTWENQWPAVDILQQELAGKQAEVGALKDALERSGVLLHSLSASLHAARHCARLHLRAALWHPDGEEGERLNALAAVEEGLNMSARLDFVCGIGVALREASLRLPDGRRSLGPAVRVVQVRLGWSYAERACCFLVLLQ